MRALALTPGEPAGIGPDLTVQIAQQQLDSPLIVVADPELLLQRAEQLSLPLRIRKIEKQLPSAASPPGELCVKPVPLRAPAQPGLLNPENAAYVLQTLQTATRGCLDGTFAGLVTGPVHKGIINDAGISFTGHTEFLAGLTGGQPVMMLACPGLRVALATTHLPLKDVSAAISAELLRRILKVLNHDLQTRFGIQHPRILVCGLNPHAGESGHLGDEEIRIINPLLEDLRNQGLNLAGPLPADTLFTPRYLTEADAVLAMYHDQGLPVLKHMGFGNAVNITLGLPIIRTSVDHGTALDLAGSGKADTGSMLAAIREASLMVANS